MTGKIYIAASFLIIVLATSPPALAQQAWTLRQCIEHAQENSLSVRQQILTISQREAQVLQNKLDFLPEVSISVSHSLNWGRSVDLQNLEIIQNRLSQSTGISASASIYILDGLSKFFSLQSSKKDLEISIQEAERLKDEISISVTKKYLELLMSMEALTAAEENLSAVCAQRDRTGLLVEAGKQPYTSLLELDAQVASERVREITARNRVISSSLDLQQLLDLSYSSTFRIAVPDIDSTIEGYVTDDVEEIYHGALGMPPVRSAELALDKGRLNLKNAEGQYFPKISVSAGHGTFYSSSTLAPDGSVWPFSEQLRNNLNPSVSIGLSIPIFNNWNIRTNVKTARLEKERLEIELQSRKQSLYKEIQTAVTEAGTYLRQMEAAKANLESMHRTFLYVEEKFNAGTLNSTDYTVAQNNLAKARSEYIQARYQFVFQLKIIDFYKGMPLTL